jgi:phosphoribosyl 1,2-cyclic phosphate phosphodiesterase
MKVTFLGTGTSQGVPVIGCDCEVCSSDDVKDDRLRTSIMLNFGNENYVIDSGPDFRQQMLRYGVKSLRGIIYTHEHKDHISGMDDVRAFNYLEKRDMELYCSSSVEEALRREFYYVFENDKYPGVPSVKIIPIENREFRLTTGNVVQPIEVMHYKLPVLGFRFEDFAYITDAKTVSAEERLKLAGLEVLIINALRIQEHISHFNLEEALHFIEDIAPKKAYITHISHLFAKHDKIESMLPENVYAAYDGVEIEG